jgi:hypothetical protein
MRDYRFEYTIYATVRIKYSGVETLEARNQKDARQDANERLSELDGPEGAGIIYELLDRIPDIEFDTAIDSAEIDGITPA